MTVFISLFAAIAGLVIYALATGKGQEIGRILFGCGTLAFLLQLAATKISLP